MLANSNPQEASMKFDSRGLAVTTDSDAVVRALDSYANELVSLGSNSGLVRAAADANPGCALLQACAASIFLYSQTTADAKKAAPYLARAIERLDDLTEREQVFIQAVDAGCAGDFESALSLYETIADQWPRDILAAKIAEFHFFETGLAKRQLDLMAKAAAANPVNSHVLAMHAFALELNGNRERADEVALKALELDYYTMWAQHCRAHVFAGQSRIAEGIAAVERYAPSWQRYSHYVIAHNTFHLATLYLADLRFDAVASAFRDHIWGVTPNAVVEQTDAILLLWYLELAGGKVDSEWREIAPHIRGYARDHLFPFLNCIYLYALARAGEAATVNIALAEMERHADLQTGELARIWLEVGVPLAKGSIAFANGDYDRAADLLGPVIGQEACGGGSDEQRAVFIESYVVSLIRAGRKPEARAVLNDYIGDRPVTPVQQRWLSWI